MAHFYGTLNGQAGEATRCGSKKSGYCAVAASYQGAIQVDLHHNSQTGQDIATVYFTSWNGSGGGTDGSSTLLYRGPINPNETELLQGLGDRLVRALGADLSRE